MTKYLSVALLAVGFHAGDALAVATDKDTSTHVEHNFSRNGLGPFNTVHTQNGNYIIRSNNRMKVSWEADNYQGNRGTRGAEIRVTRDEHDLVTTDYWTGFSFMVPNSFPDDKKTIIYQNFQNGDSINTWFCVFEIRNNTMYCTYRGDEGTSIKYEETLISNIERGRWYNFVCRFRPSRTTTQVWVDGSRKVDDRNVSIGFDINEGRGCKWGMYCWDFNNYTNGESRVLYYDNISHLISNENRGYNDVDPTN